MCHILDFDSGHIYFQKVFRGRKIENVYFWIFEDILSNFNPISWQISLKAS